MKISLRAAEFLAGKSLPHSSVDELVKKIGAQLGEVEDVIDHGNRYDGIYLVKVVSCKKHEDADKLTVCLVDDDGVVEGVERNSDGLVQVVCGAPNVKEGMCAAWIAPGAAVPVTFDKDPFRIEKREIRGMISNGMLASPSELAINDDHSGLLEVGIKGVSPPLTKPGTEIKELYGLDDVVIDIENKMFTHRPDCFGEIGVAREIFGIYGEEFKSPDWYWKLPVFKDANELKLEVKNEIPDLVPRFMAVAMDNVDVAPSPLWLQAYLMRIGVKPINNIVDFTNYFSQTTGQPLHAYDYDKLEMLTHSEGAVLVVRLPEKGENVELLNGKTIEPAEKAIMIASDKELIGVGGVMGGTTTEVDENTKRIVIECANFDMFSIRRTSMAHGLFTDAVTRFNKGQSPLQNDRVIAEMMRFASQFSGASQASDVIDVRNFDEEAYGAQIVHGTIKTNINFINSRLGFDLSRDEIFTLLRNVNFACLNDDNSDDIEIAPPFWRMDIKISEDIVEEVARLVGYDKLPHKLPSRKTNPAGIEHELILKNQIRRKLASFGGNEILTYSFVHGKLLENSGQTPVNAYQVSNALSPELQYYRVGLTPSILDHVHQNIKAGYLEFSLFELGKVHNKQELNSEKVPTEFNSLGFVTASRDKKECAYFQGRAYLENLLGHTVAIKKDFKNHAEKNSVLKELIGPYDSMRSAGVYIGDKPIGVIGEFSLKTIKAFKLPRYSAGFEILIDDLEGTLKNSYTPLPNFPGVTQDVCFEVDIDIEYDAFDEKIFQSLNKIFNEELYGDYELIDIYADEKIKGKKRITFRVNLVSYKRTLTEEFVNGQIEKFVLDIESQTKAIRI